MHVHVHTYKERDGDPPAFCRLATALHMLTDLWDAIITVQPSVLLCSTLSSCNWLLHLELTITIIQCHSCMTLTLS